MGARDPRQARGAGGGTTGVLMALMPIVLGMLSNRGLQGSGPGRFREESGGGGLGDVLGQLLGGAAGGAGGAGGLGGLLAQMQRAGYGQQADSWVSRGPNQSIPPHAMTEVFGRDGLAQISRHAGITEDQAARGLSELLPEVVDRVTPDGQVPDPDALTNSVDDFAKRLGLG